MDFYVDEDNTTWGTTNSDWVDRNVSIGGGRIKTIKIKCLTLDAIMREYGVPRYCKIDIEGNDLDALKSLKKNVDLPKFVSIESEKISWNKLLEEFHIFHELGYKKYKIVDQYFVNLHVCPNPSREGRYVDYKCQLGSSGLFGDELPGRWLDILEAIESYKRISRGYALNGDIGLFRGRSLFNLFGRIDVVIGRLRGSRNHVPSARVLPYPGWYDTHAML